MGPSKPAWRDRASNGSARTTCQHSGSLWPLQMRARPSPQLEGASAVSPSASASVWFRLACLTCPNGVWLSMEEEGSCWWGSVDHGGDALMWVPDCSGCNIILSHNDFEDYLFIICPVLTLCITASHWAIVHPVIRFAKLDTLERETEVADPKSWNNHAAPL